MFWWAVSVIFYFTAFFKFDFAAELLVLTYSGDHRTRVWFKLKFLFVLGFASLISLVIYNYTACDL